MTLTEIIARSAALESERREEVAKHEGLAESFYVSASPKTG
jgi:hypothetical protein